jgi:hypothetical protein
MTRNKPKKHNPSKNYNQISFRVSDHVLQILAAIADKERRSVASVVRNILVDRFEKRLSAAT